MRVKNGNIITDVSFHSAINNRDFLLTVLDWRELDLKFREEICNELGYEEYTDDVVNDNFSVALVVFRTNGVLDFDRVYLHILTIGIVDITQITMSIMEQLRDGVYPAVKVDITPYEKIDLLSRIIKDTDLRKVV